MVAQVTLFQGVMAEMLWNGGVCRQTWEPRTMRWSCLMPTRKPQSQPSLAPPLALPASGEPSTGLTAPPDAAVEGKRRLSLHCGAGLQGVLQKSLRFLSTAVTMAQ